MPSHGSLQALPLHTHGGTSPVGPHRTSPVEGSLMVLVAQLPQLSLTHFSPAG